MSEQSNTRVVRLNPDLAQQWSELVRVMPEQYEARFLREGITVHQVLQDPINNLKFMLDNDHSRGKWGLPQFSFLALDGNKAVGQINLRFELNAFLRDQGGHIGYSVHPSHRNRGIAQKMLTTVCRALPQFGLKRVLLTADSDNLSSQKVMQKCGATFVSDFTVPESNVLKKRCWISAIQYNKEIFDRELQHAIDATLNALEQIALQDPRGRDPYWPKWDNTWWHLCFLRELGLLHLVSEQVLDSFEYHIDTHYQIQFPKGEWDIPKGCSYRHDFYCHCSLANAMGILSDAGRSPLSKRTWVHQWIISEFMATGGYNCDEKAYSKPEGSPSFESSTAMLELLNQMTAYGCEFDSARIRTEICRWLHDRNFYQRKSTGMPADPNHLRPVFPRAYFYNPLRGYLAFLESEVQSKGESDRSQKVYDFIFEAKAALPVLNESFTSSLLIEPTYFEKQKAETKETLSTQNSSLNTPLLRAAMRPKVAKFMLGIEKSRIKILEHELCLVLRPNPKL